MITAGAPLGVEIGQGLGQCCEGGRVIETALDETDSLRQPVPHFLPEWRSGVFFDGVIDDLTEILVGPVATGEARFGREQRRSQCHR